MTSSSPTPTLALWRAPLEPALIASLESLSQQIFGRPADDLRWRLSHMPDATVAVASIGDTVIGFKLGYALSSNTYYSWLGGTRPLHRGKGIASALARLQHEDAVARGYRRIESATDDSNVAMCRTNIASGMVVCGFKRKDTRGQVLFSKTLNEKPDTLTP